MSSSPKNARQKLAGSARSPKAPTIVVAGVQSPGPTSVPSTSGSNPHLALANAKPKPQLSKAERRDIQEKQRAAKAAAKQGPGNAGSGAGSAAPGGAGSAVPSNRKPSKTGGPANLNADDSPRTQNRGGPQTPNLNNVSGFIQSSRDKDKDAQSTTYSHAETTESKIRDLRIFSHFAIPKGGAGLSTRGIKGGADVHPVIIKLALQFAEFRIVGANARCIATLTAFKAVGLRILFT